MEPDENEIGAFYFLRVLLQRALLFRGLYYGNGFLETPLYQRTEVPSLALELSEPYLKWI